MNRRSAARKLCDALIEAADGYGGLIKTTPRVVREPLEVGTPLDGWRIVWPDGPKEWSAVAVGCSLVSGELNNYELPTERPIARALFVIKRNGFEVEIRDFSLVIVRLSQYDEEPWEELNDGESDEDGGSN